MMPFWHASAILPRPLCLVLTLVFRTLPLRIGTQQPGVSSHAPQGALTDLPGWICFICLWCLYSFCSTFWWTLRMESEHGQHSSLRASSWLWRNILKHILLAATAQLFCFRWFTDAGISQTPPITSPTWSHHTWWCLWVPTPQGNHAILAPCTSHTGGSAAVRCWFGPATWSRPSITISIEAPRSLWPPPANGVRYRICWRRSTCRHGYGFAGLDVACLSRSTFTVSSDHDLCWQHIHAVQFHWAPDHGLFLLTGVSWTMGTAGRSGQVLLLGLYSSAVPAPTTLGHFSSLWCRWTWWISHLGRLAQSSTDAAERHQACYTRWQRLKISRAPLRQKLHCLAAVFWPAALHGALGCVFSEVHIHNLRKKAVSHTQTRRGGANSLLRLTFSAPMTADPGYYQLRTCVMDFRRICGKSTDIEQMWRFYTHRFTGRTIIYQGLSANWISSFARLVGRSKKLLFSEITTAASMTFWDCQLRPWICFLRMPGSKLAPIGFDIGPPCKIWWALTLTCNEKFKLIWLQLTWAELLLCRRVLSCRIGSTSSSTTRNNPYVHDVWRPTHRSIGWLAPCWPLCELTALRCWVGLVRFLPALCIIYWFPDLLHMPRWSSTSLLWRTQLKFLFLTQGKTFSIFFVMVLFSSANPKGIPRTWMMWLVPTPLRNGFRTGMELQMTLRSPPMSTGPQFESLCHELCGHHRLWFGRLVMLRNFYIAVSHFSQTEDEVVYLTQDDMEPLQPTPETICLAGALVVSWQFQLRWIRFSHVWRYLYFGNRSWS